MNDDFRRSQQCEKRTYIEFTRWWWTENGDFKWFMAWFICRNIFFSCMRLADICSHHNFHVHILKTSRISDVDVAVVVENQNSWYSGHINSVQHVFGCYKIIRVVPAFFSPSIVLLFFFSFPLSFHLSFTHAGSELVIVWARHICCTNKSTCIDLAPHFRFVFIMGAIILQQFTEAATCDRSTAVKCDTQKYIFLLLLL